jgi:hypothetical protein
MPRNAPENWLGMEVHNVPRQPAKDIRAMKNRRGQGSRSYEYK